MRMQAPFRAEETHGVLQQKTNLTRRCSDTYNWSSLYASSQSELPFEASFGAVDHTLLVLHRSGPVCVDRLNDKRSRRRTVPSGGIHLVPGGMSLGFRLLDELDTLHVYIRREVIEEVATDMAVGDPAHLEIAADFIDCDHKMQHLLQAVLFALDDGDYPTALYVDFLSRALASQLVRNYSNARLRHAPNCDGNGVLSPVIKTAIAYMHDNLDGTINLEDIAETVNRSPSHFARRFRSEIGVPPYQYLLNLRLDRAHEMLKETRLSIAEIAYECGFSHQEHLTRLFRRRFGTTPAARRRMSYN